MASAAALYSDDAEGLGQVWWALLAQVLLVPVGGIREGAEGGLQPGAPTLHLHPVQVLQELYHLVQVQVAVIMVQLLLHLKCANKKEQVSWPACQALSASLSSVQL